MNILLTGYKGFIGSHFLSVLKQEGHTVVPFEWGDQFPSLNKIDLCIHCGAISSTTETDEIKITNQNILFTKHLIEECDTRGVPVQFSSSASVYGNTNTTFRETDLTNPRNLYAKSKQIIEHFVLSNRFNIPIQMFRYFNVYGTGEDHKGAMASPYHQFSQQAKSGLIKIFEGSETCERDFVPVETIVNTQIKFFNIKETGIWNIGTGKTKSFREVAEEVKMVYDCSIETIPFPPHLISHYQRFTCANLDKIRLTLTDHGLQYDHY